MPAITLPDGSVRRHDGPVTGAALAAAIGPGLARAALAMKVDGEIRDLARPIEHDAAVVFITRRDPEALGLIRHDAAHVLAEAVQALYPGTQVTIGPAIEDGFYYDFARNEPFTPEDFPAIEAKMREIIAAQRRLRAAGDRPRRGDRVLRAPRREIQGAADPRPAARPRRSPSIARATGSTSAAARTCARTGDVGDAFKLMKVAGAYWRGDHRNAMLSRIYGTAWRDQKRARRLSAPARGGGAARPSPHRPRDGPLPPAGGGGRQHLLAPERLAPVSRRRSLSAPPAGCRRLPGGAHAATGGPRAVGALGPLGEVPRAHVRRHRRGGRQDAGAEADELPVPRADLPPGRALLSRAAAAAGRVRVVPPLRALGRAARHACGCAPSPRTTRTSSAPRPDRATRRRASSRCSPRSTATSASPSSA